MAWLAAGSLRHKWSSRGVVIDKHSSVLQVVQEYTLILGGLNASRKLHARLLERVMRLPMSFFDSQPSGRLLNRFTKDTEAVDTEILVGPAKSSGLRVMSLMANSHGKAFGHASSQDNKSVTAESLMLERFYV